MASLRAVGHAAGAVQRQQGASQRAEAPPPEPLPPPGGAQGWEAAGARGLARSSVRGLALRAAARARAAAGEERWHVSFEAEPALAAAPAGEATAALSGSIALVRGAGKAACPISTG